MRRFGLDLDWRPQMRVIAGRLGGRRLVPPPGDSVRPTSDRAREALFSTLLSILGDLEGLSVLDLCCGTGALAIEALSRGALEATLVDIEVGPARVNLELLELEDRATLVPADAADFLRQGYSRYGLILCDPPYRIAARLEPDLQQLAPARLALGGSLVIEGDAHDHRPLEFGGLDLERERTYGNTLLRIWR